MNSEPHSPVFKIDGFTLRLVRMDDLEAYHSLIERNRARLEDFFAGIVAITQTLDQTRDHLDDVTHKAQRNNYFPFVLQDDATGALAGSIQIKNIDWTIPKAEIGYYIDGAYQGRGLIARSVGLLVDFCFHDLKMNKLYLRTHHSNAGSIAVAERNGFKVEGTLRKDYKTTRGEVIDVLYYGIIASTSK